MFLASWCSCLFGGVPLIRPFIPICRSIRLKHGSSSAQVDIHAVLKARGLCFETIALNELNRLNDRLSTQFPELNVDITSDGVLTVEKDGPGTAAPAKSIVVNKHEASGKIWYSSPFSPPMYFSPSLTQKDAVKWVDDDSKVVLENILVQHSSKLDT